MRPEPAFPHDISNHSVSLLLYFWLCITPPGSSKYVYGDLHVVPASVTDAIVAEDFMQQQQQHGGEADSIAFTLYILSPDVAKPYAYSYDGE